MKNPFARLRLRRLRPRFSLRSLLCFAPLCLCLFGLWWRWEPWTITRTVDIPFNESLPPLPEFSPNGNWASLAYEDGRLQLIDLTSGCITWLVEKPPPVKKGWEGLPMWPKVRFSESGDIAWSLDTTLTEPQLFSAWDLKRKRCVASWDISKMGINKFSISPDGSMALCPSYHEECPLTLFEIDKEDRMKAFPKPELLNDGSNNQDDIFGTAIFLEENRKVVFAAKELGLLLWELGPEERVLPVLQELPVKSTPIASWDHSLLFRNFDKKTLFYCTDIEGSVDVEMNCYLLRMCGYLDRHKAILLTDGCGVNLVKPDTLIKIRKFGEPREDASMNSVSPDQTRLGTVLENEIRFWDLAAGKLIHTLPYDGKFGLYPVFVGSKEQFLHFSIHAGPVERLRWYIRRRPEQWWGIAWLPESWLALVFASALVWSLWRDRRAFRAPLPTSENPVGPAAS